MITLKPKKKYNLHTNELRRLITIGMENRFWRNVDDCADKIAMKRGTLAHHVKDNYGEEHVLPTIRKVADFLTSKSVKFKLRIGSDASLPTEVLTPTQRNAHGPPASSDELSPQRMDRLTVALERLTETMTKQLQPHGLLAGTLFNELVTGTVVCEGQTRDGIRFVLNEGSFRPLDGEITDQEIEDTRRLIEELRRRLGIFAQLEPVKHKDVRGKIFRALEREIDFLYVAFKQTQQVLPTGAAAHLKELDAAREIGRKLLKD